MVASHEHDCINRVMIHKMIVLNWLHCMNITQEESNIKIFSIDNDLFIMLVYVVFQDIECIYEIVSASYLIIASVD